MRIFPDILIYLFISAKLLFYWLILLTECVSLLPVLHMHIKLSNVFVVLSSFQSSGSTVYLSMCLYTLYKQNNHSKLCSSVFMCCNVVYSNIQRDWDSSSYLWKKWKDRDWILICNGVKWLQFHEETQLPALLMHASVVVTLLAYCFKSIRVIICMCCLLSFLATHHLHLFEIIWQILDSHSVQQVFGSQFCSEIC